jgi:hypothetical protein
MPTVVIGNNTGDDYSGVDDSSLAESSANANLGGLESIYVNKVSSGSYRYALIKFTGISSMPSGYTITDASLSLYRSNSGGTTTTITLKRVLRDWIEGTGEWDDRTSDSPASCCYNEYASQNAWTTAGCRSDGNDRSSSGLSEDISVGSGYKTISDTQLTTDVSGMYGGTYANYGWQGERTDGADDGETAVFASSEGTDGQRPYLSVTYTESGGATGHPTASRFRNMHRNNSVRYA